MEKLWAPWRVEYLTKVKSGCLFCNALAARDDDRLLIIERWERAFTIMNRYPYNNGHLMVAPIRHIGEIESLDDEEILEVTRLISRGIKSMNLIFKPQGYNIGINQGSVAGAGVVNHIHIHLVPRWQGDTNFMPICAQTKVISEGLKETYNRLKQGLIRLDNP